MYIYTLLMATKFKVCAATDATHVACISGNKIKGLEVKGIQQICLLSC